MAGDSLIEIKHLIRTAEPEKASARVVVRLIQAVAEWNPDACLDVTFGSHRGKRTLVLAQYGTEQQGWEGDVGWAFRGVAELGPKRSGVPTGDQPAWTSVLEVRPSRELSAMTTSFLTHEDGDEDQVGRAVLAADPRSHQLRTLTPWPNALYDNLSDTAELLSDHSHLLARFRLAPAAPVEVDMLGDILNRTWGGGSAELHAYLGRPVRLRAMIASTQGQVPARFRALARRWGTSLSVVPVDAELASDAWDGPPGSLAGHVVPEGVALSVLRVPAAGNQPFPGMETRHPSATNHPLDPVPPRPGAPVRLGAAHTVTGRRVDAALDVRDLVRHMFIEGQSGAGKSTLISVLVRELTRQGYGCTLLDPHGATIDQILRELPDDVEKTYVVRHEDPKHPVPLDIITGDVEQVERMVDTFVEMVQLMYDPSHSGIVGPRWRRWFGLIAIATQHALGERASLVSIAEVGSDVDRVRALAAAIRTDHPQLAKSLVDEIVNDRSSEAASLLAWCISKLQPLVSTTQMRAILGTGYDAVDVRTFIDDGRTLLIDLASPVLGEPASRMLGALWLLKHRTAMGARERPERPHVIIVDEAHLFQYGALPSLLAEGRKFGLGVVVATQFMGQLRADLAESLEANAGSLITLRTGLPYAQRSSVRLGGWPVEEIVRLPNLTAAASLSHDGTMTEPFTLSIDHHRRMERAGARGERAAERAAAVLARSRDELWQPFADAEPVTAVVLDELLARSSAIRGASKVATFEGTEFDVILFGPGDRKITVIATVRELTGLGLKEAKELVESWPSVVLEAVSRADAEAAHQALEAAGATAGVASSGPRPAKPPRRPRRPAAE